MSSVSPVVPTGQRSWLLALALAVIVFHLARVLAVVPDWIAGVAPIYPNQYESRASSAVIGIALMTTVILNTRRSPPTWRRVAAVAVLLVIATGGIIWEVRL